jgi:hypothetical protein
VKCRVAPWLSFLVISGFLVLLNRSYGQEAIAPKRLPEEPKSHAIAPKKYPEEPKKHAIAPKRVPEAIAPNKYEYTSPRGYAAPKGWAAPTPRFEDDPFLIKKSFDCSDINLLKAELKKVVESVGMSMVDSDEPGAFSERLPDELGSQDGDVVEVKLSWAIDQPGKRIDTSVLYKRVIWVEGATYEPRRVAPEQAGIERFQKLKAAITTLVLPVAVVAESPTPAALGSANTTPTQ